MDTHETPAPSAEGLMLAAAVRRALKLTQRQLDHLLHRNPALEPRRLGGRRVFTAADLERLRAALAAAPARRAPRSS